MMLPFYENIPFICIFLCMVNGITMPLYAKSRFNSAATIAVSCIVSALSAVLLAVTASCNIHFTYQMGHFPAPWGNEIAAGPLEAALATLFSLVTALSLLGGRKAQESDILEPKRCYYYVMMNLLLAALLALTYTNDVFTGYVFIEISTIAACAIVMAKDTAKTIAATIRYLVISLLGSGLFLIGIVILYCVTGHLLMPNVREAVMTLWENGAYREPMTVLIGLITAGLCIKSALFPFHAWLPTAHGGATTSSSAILSGLVLKGYIVLLIKLYYQVFSIGIVRQTQMTGILFVFGVLGMLIGSIHAIREEHIKRMLAYSSVAQIGYVYLGIGLGTDAGLVAAIYQMFVHAVTKPLLFLSAGRLVEVQGHEKSLYRLRGAARTDPFAGVLFSLGAFSMIGLPLLGGFLSKWFLADASLMNPVKLWSALLALTVSSVLNALYYVPAVIALWSPSEFETKEKQAKDFRYGIAAVILGLGVIALGTLSQPITGSIEAGLLLLRGR